MLESTDDEDDEPDEEGDVVSRERAIWKIAWRNALEAFCWLSSSLTSDDDEDEEDEDDDLEMEECSCIKSRWR